MFFICSNEVLPSAPASRPLIRLKATKETILIALAVSFVALGPPFGSARCQPFCEMDFNGLADARCDAFLAVG
jgi:hypothetical protein